MRQRKCEHRNFNGCMEVCKKAGETFQNCAQACSVAVKNICSRKTRLSVGNRAINTNIETEHNYMAWFLFLVFLIIVGFVIWKLLF